MKCNKLLKKKLINRASQNKLTKKNIQLANSFLMF